MSGEYVHSCYQVVRKKRDGSDQIVTLSIYDNGGLVSGANRYLAVAVSDDGKAATGNHESSMGARNMAHDPLSHVASWIAPAAANLSPTSADVDDPLIALIRERDRLFSL